MTEGEDQDPLGFADEERRARRDRYAHRRDPDAEAYGIGPDRSPAPPRMAPGTSRYTWFVGVVAVLVIAYVSVNSLRTKGPGSRGVQVGAIAPPFAAPLATGDLSGDVNVARRTGQGSAGKVVACSIHRPDVLTICDLYRNRPVVLAFFATRGRQCTRELNTLQRISAERPGVAFAAIAIRGDRGDVRNLIRDHGWTFPVGFDHDGVLANLYSVAICPQLTFLRKGGRVAGTTFGEVGEVQLRRRVDALAAGAPLPAAK
jgi:hypothetical protein